MTQGRSDLRVGLRGCFDLDDVADFALARITEHELARRLPGVDVARQSPFTAQHTGLDGGRPPASPGSQRPGRRDLAEAVDAVVAVGDVVVSDADWWAARWGIEVAHARALDPAAFFVRGVSGNGARTPLAWFSVGVPRRPVEADAVSMRAVAESLPYVTVRDEPSRARLRQIGVDRPIEVTPDPLLLMSRVLPRELLTRRRDYLRAMGWLPADGEVILVHGEERSAEVAASMAELLQAVALRRGVTLVLAEGGRAHGAHTFADRVEEALNGHCMRLPPYAGLEDLGAAVASARAVVDTSHLFVTFAAAMGVRGVALDTGVNGRRGEHLAGLDEGCGVHRVRNLDELEAVLPAMLNGAPTPARLDSLQATLDGQLDELADSLARVARPASGFGGLSHEHEGEPAGAPLGELTALRRAYTMRGRALENERSRHRSLSLEAEVATLRRFVGQLDPTATSDARSLATVASLREYLGQLETDHRETLARLDRTQQTLDERDAQFNAAHLEMIEQRELARKVMTSRTWRYTEPLRQVYRALRSLVLRSAG